MMSLPIYWVAFYEHFSEHLACEKIAMPIYADRQAERCSRHHYRPCCNINPFNLRWMRQLRRSVSNNLKFNWNFSYSFSSGPVVLQKSKIKKIIKSSPPPSPQHLSRFGSDVHCYTFHCFAFAAYLFGAAKWTLFNGCMCPLSAALCLSVCCVTCVNLCIRYIERAAC